MLVYKFSTKKTAQAIEINLGGGGAKKCERKKKNFLASKRGSSSNSKGSTSSLGFRGVLVHEM